MVKERERFQVRSGRVERHTANPIEAVPSSGNPFIYLSRE